MDLRALTEPTVSGAKAIEDLETERDEQSFIILTDAALKRSNADKLRIRELVAVPRKRWYQFWKSQPAVD